MNTEIKEGEETFTRYDMESAFWLGRDKLYNPNGSLGGFRFVNFQEFMDYRKQMIELSEKTSQLTNKNEYRDRLDS